MGTKEEENVVINVVDEGDSLSVSIKGDSNDLVHALLGVSEAIVNGADNFHEGLKLLQYVYSAAVIAAYEAHRENLEDGDGDE